MLSSSASLTIGPDGNIMLSQGRMLYMVTNTSTSNHTNAMLLDSGNLILIDQSLRVLWQSFDYPTDTLLPGMRLGHNSESGISWSLVSWRNTGDAAPGVFSLELRDPAPGVFSQDLIIKRDSKIYWTGDARRFNLTRNPKARGVSTVEKCVILGSDSFTISQILLDVSGQLKLQTWTPGAQRWYSLEAAKCGYFGRCGPFSICNESAHIPCGCLPGFKSKYQDSWTQEPGYNLNWNLTAKGCERKTPLQCSKDSVSGKDDFKIIPFVDFPSHPLNLDFWSAEDCKLASLGNCSWIAYAFDKKRGCLVWDNDLRDLKQLLKCDSNGRNFYLKLAASELIANDKNSSNRSSGQEIDNGNKRRLWIIITLITSLITLCLIIFYVKRKFKKKGEDLLLFDLGVSLKANNPELTELNKRGKRSKEAVELPLFSFSSVSAATENFSATNKLGEGGFGPVYKGRLLKGYEIAVKRLSRRSGQGWEELKNEALLIAKLQHKNLVRFLGCCIEQDEKILIYEYMLNKSLDFFLFDATKRRFLDWETRIQIIEGIAQGLLYLHQYSRVRIIHRDLKASNILLDKDMNPKISDFGMARIFGENKLQANTNRIVGTYGYMSPEYALEGLFSIKSDVFSYGVLLLEIVSGKKNTGFYQTDSLNLLGYAWDMWTSDRALDLLDPVLEDISSKHKLLRCINIALLCVQESAEDRPTMSEVVSMLINESAAPPSLQQPAFSHVRGGAKLKPFVSRTEKCSVNDATVSILEAR